MYTGYITGTRRKKYVVKLTFKPIIILMLLIGVFGYVGALGQYNYFALYSIIVFFIILFHSWNRHEIVTKRACRFLLIGILVMLYAIFKNYPLSLTNLPIIYLCFLVMSISTIERSKKMLFSLMKWISVVHAIVTLLLSIIPGVMLPIVITFTGGINIETAQISGLAGEVSANAFIMTLGCVIYIAELFTLTKNKDKVVKLLAIIILFLGVILTEKRSFMLIVPVVFLILFILYIWNSGKSGKAIFLVTVVPALIIGYLIFFQDAISRLLSDNVGGGINLNGRDALWGIAFRMIQLHPFAGNGLRSYDVNFNRFYSNNWTFAGAHNSYIQYAAEIGLFFAIVFFYICFMQTYRMIYTYRKMLNNKLINNDSTYLLASIGILLIMFIYGLSGNPFNNPHQMLVGAIVGSCGIEIVRKYKEIQKKATI